MRQGREKRPDGTRKWPIWASGLSEGIGVPTRHQGRNRGGSPLTRSAISDVVVRDRPPSRNHRSGMLVPDTDVIVTYCGG